MEAIKQLLINATNAPDTISDIEVVNLYATLKGFARPVVFNNEGSVKDIIISQFLLFYRNSLGLVQDFSVSFDELPDLHDETLLTWFEEVMAVKPKNSNQP